MRPSPRRSNFDSTAISPMGWSLELQPMVGDTQSALGQANQTVVVGVAAINDAGLVGLLVVEQEEVVADELHLGKGVVDRHRRRRMVLGAHDPPGLMVVGCDAVWLQRLIGRVLWCVGQR